MKTAFKIVKVFLIVLLVFVVLLCTIAAVWCYNCTHYWQSDYNNTIKAGFQEKQYTLPDGSLINYAEGPNNGEPLLLIHGQTGAWEDYTRVLPQLSEKYHVFAVDCYGHGSSSHNHEKYNLKSLGDDLISFINDVINQPTIISGHSSGGLIASYIAAYGEENIKGAVLEDPPVFSTEQDYFEKSFAYQDTYKNVHEYLNNEQTECWEAYYMRNCLWGNLFMPTSSLEFFERNAQEQYEKNPDKPVQFLFMPESVNFSFLYTKEYDLLFGENFYNYSWHSDISHEQLMSDINVPTVFIHAKASYTEDGILQAASSDEQARTAVELIGNCEFIELESNHNIHRFNSETFLSAFEMLENMK